MIIKVLQFDEVASDIKQLVCEIASEVKMVVYDLISQFESSVEKSFTKKLWIPEFLAKMSGIYDKGEGGRTFTNNEHMT